MFLLRLSKLDFSLIFNQGFRLLLVINAVICYCLLFIFHALLLQSMYQICGSKCFSVITRWMFTRHPENPASKENNAILVACYLTNVTDMTMMSFGVLFIALFMCECCLMQRKRRQLDALMRSQKTSVRHDDILDGSKQVDARILRQRLSKRSSTTRFISRLALLMPASILATAHLACSIITYLLFHFVQRDVYETSNLSATDRLKVTSQINIANLERVRWRMLIYSILSCFMCGFYWSMSGIDTSMLKAIYARSRRQDQFRRMNASVFTEENTIIA